MNPVKSYHFCAFLLILACFAAGMSKPLKTSEKNQIVVFFTGNEMGQMQPCGCAGGQLGGFDRRGAVFQKVPPSRRLLVDTGNLVLGDLEQDIIKFNIIVQAYNLLDYDVVRLTEEDTEIARNVGLLEGMNSLFSVIAAHKPDSPLGQVFERQFNIDGKKITIRLAAFDAEKGKIADIPGLFGGLGADDRINILIVNHWDESRPRPRLAGTGRAGIKRMSEIDLLDCLICPPESDKPEVIQSSDSGPMVITTGREGKYVGKLTINAGKNKPELSYKAVPVTEDLPKDASQVELYKTYQQLVEQADLIRTQPRFSLPNGLKYVGSVSCKTCHTAEYNKWSQLAHAHAFSTLKDVGSEHDPQCVICHTVGMEYESGFMSEEQTPEMKNVGCENCHGPGSKHIQTVGQQPPDRPRADCGSCHTSDNSPNYAGNEQEYYEKIIHWSEPPGSESVK